MIKADLSKKYTGREFTFTIDSSFNPSFNNLNKVLIFGVFSDPSEVFYANGNTGDFYDEEFPADTSMVDSIIKLALDELTRISRPKDILNDGEGIEDQRSKAV